ncbi:MAG: hypothetical protein KJ626_11570 [Verrucomicrobia bacterium]|nr:hypothetical protein [Verrucomicrobiota bacterium]
MKKGVIYLLAGVLLIGIAVLWHLKRGRPNPSEPSLTAQSEPVSLPEDRPGENTYAPSPAEFSEEMPEPPPASDKNKLDISRKPGEPLNPPPVPAHIPEPAEPPLGWAEAEVSLASRNLQPRNVYGRFETIRIAPGETMQIRLKWPKADPDTPVAIEVANAGRLDDGSTSKLIYTDSSGCLDFGYTASDWPGMCMVVLRSGFQETSLNFWVPPPGGEDEVPGL